MKREVVASTITAIVCVVLLTNFFSQPVVVINEVQAKEPEVILIEEKIDWTPERIEKEIRTVFYEDPDVAVAVAWAESELKANAYNPEAHRGCSGSVGIFQIACIHTHDKESLKDVRTNILKAKEIWLRKGWQPWGAYTDGRYKQYLP